MNYKKGFTLIELLVVVAIIGILASVVLTALNGGRIKARDSARISAIRQIRYALELYYYANNNQYPQCLYPVAPCSTTLNGTIFMKTVPKDPLTGLGYTYAARGSGANCTSYHLGTSLEEKTNKILLSGADATAQSVCANSNSGFSGLSYATGGQPCNNNSGTAQPTTAINGETCYDVVGF